MMSKFSDIAKLKEKLINDISKSQDISQLEDIRISSLGKKRFYYITSKKYYFAKA